MKKKSQSLIPQLKKDIPLYLGSEEGRITKESLIALGKYMGGAALAAAINASLVSGEITHQNSLTLKYENQRVSGSHAHHASES